MSESENLSKLTHLNSPGFQMTFKNGMTISVVWHTSAYCSRKSDKYFGDDIGPASSPDCEIAVWDKNGNFYPLGEEDSVIGYASPDKAAEVINFVKNL
jgi:hypothetical protein